MWDEYGYSWDETDGYGYPQDGDDVAVSQENQYDYREYEENADGSFSAYDAWGNYLGDVDADGNPVETLGGGDEQQQEQADQQFEYDFNTGLVYDRENGLWYELDGSLASDPYAYSSDQEAPTNVGPQDIDTGSNWLTRLLGGLFGNGSSSGQSSGGNSSSGSGGGSSSGSSQQQAQQRAQQAAQQLAQAQQQNAGAAVIASLQRQLAIANAAASASRAPNYGALLLAAAAAYGVYTMTRRRS